MSITVINIQVQSKVTDFFKNKNQELIKYTTQEGFERVMIKKT